MMWAEKFLSSIEKQPELMQKYQLRQADIAKVRERLKKQLPTDLALKAEAISLRAAGDKHGALAKVREMKALHAQLAEAEAAKAEGSGAAAPQRCSSCTSQLRQRRASCRCTARRWSSAESR